MFAFDVFFEAIWGYEPYPWQTRLAERVVEAGWPDLLDLPTGSGKTASLDIALYHMLVSGRAEAPRRVFLVVDRRIIVDQAAARASHLARRLDDGLNGSGPEVLQMAAQRLRDLVGPGAPLLATEALRGAQVRLDAWARYPHVPVLAASTVDQVGSRILFRGYGLSASARPIHAGLMGCDTLFLLDEVHLQAPFADLLRQLGEVRGLGGHRDLRREARWVSLSATPVAGEEPTKRFGLGDEDRRHPRLRRILAASKPASLRVVKVPGRGSPSEKRSSMAAAAADAARELIEEGREAVGVVVNRVDTARRVWYALSGDMDFDVELLTGRMRPLDRERILERTTARVDAGRVSQDATGGRPLILVATQCIEAGADYDFDGLVTECAPLDALRQRFGRLDRRGQCSERIGSDARAIVLGRTDADAKSDFIYGGSMFATWEWLTHLASDGIVDFGVEAIEPLIDEAGETVGEMVSLGRKHAVLMPTYLEQWSQTRPEPHADPDPAPFLHGIPDPGERTADDVRVVWRADLSRDDLRIGAGRRPAVLEAVAMRLDAVPPGTLEALSLPVWTVRNWLREADHEEDVATELADVEGVAEHPAPYRGGVQALGVVCWQSNGPPDILEPARIRPGMTIVVPAEAGGIGPHGTFDPDVRETVEDLGDLAQYRERGRATLRLDPRVVGADLQPYLQPVREALSQEDPELVRVVDGALSDVREWAAAGALLTGKQQAARASWLIEIIDAFPSRRSGRGFRLIGPGAEGDHPIVVATGRTEVTSSSVTVMGERDDDASFQGEADLLRVHLSAVGDTAARSGRSIGLPDPFVQTLYWAGRLHDLGKCDPRFQLMMHAGDEVASRWGEPLAKSSIPWQDRASWRRVRDRAAYPARQRHELVSLSLLEGAAELRERLEANGVDWDLLLHLVASHHGWCRPIAPVSDLEPDEGEPVAFIVDDIELQGSTFHGAESLDSGVIARYFRLGRRIGWHELAYLEAILRLADHRCSEEGSR